METEQIRVLWKEHESAAFPAGHTGEVHGCNLFLLSIDIGTAIIAYIEGEGRLVPRRVEVLQEQLAQLHGVLPKLNEAGQHYFGRLAQLGDMIVPSLRAKKLL